MKSSERVTPAMVVRIGIASIFMVAIIGCTFGPTIAQTDKRVEMAFVDDNEILRMLSSEDRETSFEAAREIFNRGEKMIPLLAKNKGNHAPYAWGSLGNPRSGSITLAPSNNPEWDEGRIITVEAASIYLICAIYRQDFEFATSAYLKSKDDEVIFNRYNTTERLAEAWDSVEKWIEMMNSEGLTSLREKNIRPLFNTKFYF